ncbi:MAG TPA: helix-turn-helix domain-containing protein [Microbacteriaceae bacterium]
MSALARKTISATRAGELVRRAREDIGYTQSELAARAGTSQAALSAVESGSRIPSDGLLTRLLHAALLRPSIPLALYAEELRSLAAQHGLAGLRVFGSVARGDDGPDSDVDVLARRIPGTSALDVLSFSAAAADLLGFPVELLLDDSRGTAVEPIKNVAVPL